MIALLAALVVGPLRSNGLRSAVTLFAVSLGVALALAIDLANATAVASFAASVNVVANQVNLQVLGVGRGFDERALSRVERVPGVSFAGPALEDAIVIGAKTGDPFSGEILRVLGVDLLRPLPRGGASEPGALTKDRGPEPALLIEGRGAIVSQRIAQRYHLRIGGPLDALAGDRPAQLRVAAIVPRDGVGIDSSVVFVDIVTAQELFDKVGRLDRIDCIVDPARLTEVQRAVSAVVPPGARVIEPKVRTGEIRRMLRSFQLNLAALSYIALLVAMYLIYNMVAISVVQRRPEIGTVRALGATRRQIFVAFLIEGTLVGLAGSVLGLALGAGLAQFSVGAVARTVDTLYIGTHADGVVYAAWPFVKAFIIGVGAAIVSAVVPALDAVATAPALTMRSRGFEGRVRRPGAGLAIAAAILLAGAYLATLGPALGGIPVFGYIAGLLIIFGISLAVPLLIVALATALRRSVRSPTAVLGALNLAASLRRNSVAVAALMIAIAMMVSIAVLIGSFRTTVIAWADDTLKADLFVRPVGLQDASYDARFSPDVGRRIRRLAGVAAVDAFRAISIPLDGSLTTLGATDFQALSHRRKMRFLGSVDQLTLARTLPGSTGALISEPFATRFGKHVGDGIPIDTPAGPITFTVTAIYNDYSSDAGIMIIDARTFVRLFHDDSVNSLAIYAEPAVDLSALRSRVVRSVLPLRIDVQTTRELRTLVITIFNRTFAITSALYVISIAIAVFGVVSTLFALVLERRQAIGILRYIGLSRGQVRKMVLFEAAYIGLLGGTSGVVAGMLLALLLIFVINRQAFGWLIELHVPYAFLFETIVLVVIAALLAGIYPANVAGRIRTADAVRTE